jgi:chromosome segregation ATPase
MLSSSIKNARDRVSALRGTIELLRADSEILAERRETFLHEGEQVLLSMVEIESATDSDQQRLTSEYEVLISRLEDDARRLREEWISFRRSLETYSSVYDAVRAIPRSTPPLLRVEALSQLLRRMEGGPGSSLLLAPRP